MKWLFASCVSVAVLFPVSAGASTVMFTFSGQLTQVASLDPASPFPDPVDVGTPFSGTFNFDSNALDGVLADVNTGSYTSTGGSFGMSLTLAGLSFDFSEVNIGVLNNYAGPWDYYLVTFAENPSAGNPTGILLELTLIDTTATAFGSDGLPLSAPALGNFSGRSFLFTDTIQDNQVEVEGSIDTLAEVPEPASLVLLGLPLASMVRQRLRRRV
jgi:hypothetical protein